MLAYERKAHAMGYSTVAGVDEAGRGPLAGPVVAAACILPLDMPLTGIRDSKQLTASARYQAFEQILSFPGVYFGIGVIDAILIDQVNILQATFQAMLIAINQLVKKPDYVLIDGNQMPDKCLHGEPVVKGDALSASIAAASIIAKVTRDQIMEFFAIAWPGYKFNQHKGYGTEAHLTALKELGPCPIHRSTFKGVKKSND